MAVQVIRDRVAVVTGGGSGIGRGVGLALARRGARVVLADLSAERLERAVARDGEAMRPFLARWQHDEDAHFRADRTRARADVVIAPP